MFNQNEDQYTNDDARRIATERRYTDVKLNNVDKTGYWQNNNWFAMYWVENDEYLSDLSYDYDEAIIIAKELAEIKI